MTNDIKIFLYKYILSLNERTRREKNGDKIGFDWIIYNLAIYKGWIPIRLPFFREPEKLTCKTEAEYGIDFSFLLPNKKELIIFALKDEKLNYKNWSSCNFKSDLEMACMPDYSIPELAEIDKVTVILAYNKDEDDAGEDLFNRFKINNEKKLETKLI